MWLNLANAITPKDLTRVCQSIITNLIVKTSLATLFRQINSLVNVILIGLV